MQRVSKPKPKALVRLATGTVNSPAQVPHASLIPLANSARSPSAPSRSHPLAARGASTAPGMRCVTSEARCDDVQERRSLLNWHG